MLSLPGVQAVYELGVRDDGELTGLLAPSNTDLGQELALSQVYDALKDVPDLVWVHITRLDRRVGNPPTGFLRERIRCAADERLCWTHDDTPARVRLGFQEARDA